MATIELLDEHLINQIKAGEVVESPHSMLKELIENSIDAGSTEVIVQIKNNGLDLVEIKDNGNGISFDQLPLAFSRHATSKIKSFGDIYKVYSYGFRGEALASISSVSKVRCISRPVHDKEAGKIEIHGGETISVQSLRQDLKGTVITIKELFYNTPARLKFLKSSRTLRNQINQILYSFVLTHPTISFHLRFDEELPIIFEKIAGNKQDLLKLRTTQVITQLRSIKTKRELYETTFEHESHSFELFICPESSRGGHRHQYIFVNNRLVEDKKIKAIIQRKMTQKCWPIGASGDYFLFIKIPANLIDPNVHPSKTIVKFIFPEIVESSIAHLIDKLPVKTTAIEDKPKFNGKTNENKSEVPLKANRSIEPIRSNHSPTFKLFHQEKNITQKSNRFFIAEFSNDSINLIHKGLLLKNFLINSARSFNGETLPLLVALKLNILPNKEFQKSLLHFGFEIEEDSINNFLFLKEIPMYLTQVEDLNLIRSIIEDFYKKYDTYPTYQQYLLNMPDKLFETKDKVAEKIMAENQEHLNSSFYMRVLSEENVDKLFNENNTKSN